MSRPMTLVPRANEMERLFDVMHQASRSEASVTAAVRQDRLRRLLALLTENTAAFEAAINADFGHRSVHETRLLETLVVETGIKLASRRLDGWKRPNRIATQ